MDGENGAKTIVYNMKRDSKKKGTEKKEQRKRKESKRLKKYNSKKEEFHTIIHNIRA